MGKTYRSVRTCKSRVRKYNGKCEECGKSVCSCSIYQYVDESNAAISNNSPYLCAECYSKKYNVKILSPIENYKKKLVNKFSDYLEKGVDFNNTENIIKIINMTK